jgi:hypothetical protein
MNSDRQGPLARSNTSARVVVPVVGVLVAALVGSPAAADAATLPSAMNPSGSEQVTFSAPVPFRPANVPWPLSIARARKAARAKAVRAWSAREPRIVSVHRVSYSRVNCRVTWRPETGGKLIRTVKVKRTSAYGVQASAA